MVKYKSYQSDYIIITFIYYIDNMSMKRDVLTPRSSFLWHLSCSLFYFRKLWITHVSVDICFKNALQSPWNYSIAHQSKFAFWVTPVIVLLFCYFFMHANETIFNTLETIALSVAYVYCVNQTLCYFSRLVGTEPYRVVWHVFCLHLVT